MKTSLIASAAISALLLTGCATDSTQPSETVTEAPTASPTPSEAPTQEVITLDKPFYVKTPEGSEIVVDFSRENPTDVEEFRTATGADPVTYAHVSIDNRKGSEYSSVYEVTLYDAEGNSYAFNDLELYHFSEWGATLTEDGNYVMPDGTAVDEATADQFNDMEYALYEKYVDDGADPLEASESWLAGPGDLPEEFTGITIEANGAGSGTPMVPLSEKDSYVVPGGASDVEAPESAQEDDPSTWQGTTPEGEDFAVVGPPPADVATGPTTYDEWVAQGSICTDEAVANLPEDDLFDAAWDCA